MPGLCFHGSFLVQGVRDGMHVLHFNIACYHGARCLSHLFGFAEVLRLLFSSTTPSLVSSANKNSSILAARRSFVSLYFSDTAVNAVTNSGVVV